MARSLCLAFSCVLFLAANLRAQEVTIARESPKYPKAVPVGGASSDAPVQKAIPLSAKSEPAPPAEGPKIASAKTEAPKSAIVEVRSSTPTLTRASSAKKQTPAFLPASATARNDRSPRFASTPVPKPAPVVAPASKVDVEEEDPAPVVQAKPVVTIKKAEVVKVEQHPTKTEVAASRTPAPADVETKPARKVEVAKAAPPPPPKIDMSNSHLTGPRISEAAAPQPISFSGETAFIKVADGFDFPVGKPDAQGYYKARGFRSHGHLGEDWDGVGGGDTDLGDPVYCIGQGIVVFARDCHMGWGNVIIVRHSYRENGSVHYVDSLYGHLDKILVRRGQAIARGQQIATIGNAHGLYDAHLHLEIRKNLEIGMSRAAFARDFSNYYDPTQFINSHRHLQSNGATYRVAMNTFTHDARINFDRARNFSHAHTGGGSSESAANLKKALAKHGE